MKSILTLLGAMFGPIIIAMLFTGGVYAILYFISKLLGY
jgi:hypothetical protein